MPPGAIATPGADSLKAAAHPAKRRISILWPMVKVVTRLITNLASHNKSVQDT
ncbi:hypothetical protein OHD31_01970 [Escherichia coli]|nr:hypothetical protein [Escherichia coli]